MVKLLGNEVAQEKKEEGKWLIIHTEKD